ncbi:pentatricopeptide repeat protein [Kitasatospora sp. GP30]|uniref:AfsR/SARP family transcriptional regulator n=1 Tax=Kitasatospora sp. GP30 TaxID=3035084 RepID=UPI000C70615B|nr:BTAD domain-containing putative transcriptional regulator [Kitasatospora sp. GP30]MDH6139923.1 pentatricopeptide repeat protein [Kitasatospora sp. GP30]
MDDGARHSVEVRFLGCFSLTVNGSPIRQWRAGKARNLFQYLVLNKDQLVTRDQLYDALWPESEFPGGSSLKVAAHALRRVLQAHPDRPGDTGISIVYRDFGYSIHIEDFGSDVEEFQRLVSDGLRAHRAGDAERTDRSLRAALGLYSGEFLPGESAAWVVEQREYLKSLAMRALDVVRAAAVTRDDFDDLIQVCRQTLGIDRYHEETYRVLMAAHGRRGEFDRARSWYELCSRRLMEDLAVAPDRETERTLQRIIPRTRLAPVRLAG